MIRYIIIWILTLEIVSCFPQPMVKKSDVEILDKDFADFTLQKVKDLLETEYLRIEKVDENLFLIVRNKRGQSFPPTIFINYKGKTKYVKHYLVIIMVIPILIILLMLMKENNENDEILEIDIESEKLNSKNIPLKNGINIQ